MRRPSASPALRQVRVVEDDRGGLAAELQVRGLELRAADGGDPPALLGRAGERHGVHAGVAGERAGRLVRAGDQVEHAGREVGGLERLGEDVGGQRGGRGGLEHDRAAGREGRRELAERQHDRVVPARDHRGDPGRLPADHGAAGEGDRGAGLLGVHGARQVRVVAEDGARRGRVVLAGAGDRHPHLGRDEPRRLLGARLEGGRQAVEGVGPVGGRARRPGTVVERAPGRADRAVHVDADGGRDGAHDLFRRRVDDGDHIGDAEPTSRPPA